MEIKSQAQLVFELKKVREALQNKDKKKIEKYRSAFIKELSIPQKEVLHEGCMTLCSTNISYHLLSMYTLLDIIDYYWDGFRFHEKEMKQGYSLLSQLSVNTKVPSHDLKDFIHLLEKPATLSKKEKLHIFLLPYPYVKDYVIKQSVPGNILIFYTNTTDKMKRERAFLEGIADYYLKDRLKGALPGWARNSEVYVNEFIAWCQGKNSMFKKY